MGWFSKLFGGRSASSTPPRVLVHEAFEGAIRVFGVPVGEAWQHREESRNGDGYSVMLLKYIHPAEPMSLVLMVKVFVLDGRPDPPEDTSWSEVFGPLFREEPELETRTVEQTTMKAKLPAVEARLSGPARDADGTLCVRERRSAKDNELFIVGAVGPEEAFEAHAEIIEKWFENAVVVPYAEA